MLTAVVMMMMMDNNQKQLETDKIKDVISLTCYSNSFGFGLK